MLYIVFVTTTEVKSSANSEFEKTVCVYYEAV